MNIRTKINVLIAAVFMNVCGLLPAAHAQLLEKEWQVGGVTRKALVYVPATATKSDTPVIFVFHGHGGMMRNSAQKFGYHKLWTEALVVYPQGLPTSGKTDPEGRKSGWQKMVGNQGDRDLKFFDAMLGSLKKDYKVDEKRIYSTGHSNGGGFTYLLWAERGDVFAAVAPSAVGAGRNLRNLKPKAALHVAGVNDQLVPFENQKQIMEFVKQLDGCDAEGKVWAKSGDLVGTLYPSKTGTPFMSVIYPGAHKFPDEAPALIVKFFKEQSKKCGRRFANLLRCG